MRLIPRIIPEKSNKVKTTIQTKTYAKLNKNKINRPWGSGLGTGWW